MLDRKMDEAQLPYCHRENIAVLAYSPLGQGLLTGKVTPGRVLRKGDYRADDPRFSVENRTRMLAFLEVLRPVAEAHGATFSQLAVAWALARPGLSHTLVGARDAAQVDENAAAGDLVLAEQDMEVIERALMGLQLEM